MCGILRLKEKYIMYISMKALRILFGIIFAALLIFNTSISNNKDIPESLSRKIGNISIIIIFIMVALSAWFGIFPDSE